MWCLMMDLLETSAHSMPTLLGWVDFNIVLLILW
jgi:hypothetical protein